jgi:hypothetical protein
MSKSAKTVSHNVLSESENENYNLQLQKNDYVIELEQNNGHSKSQMLFAVNNAVQLLYICISAYPNFNKYQDQRSLNNAINLWANHFVDDDWTIVGLAVNKHIATSKYPPSIAEIRELMVDIQRPDLIPFDEAYELVAKYIDVTDEYDNHKVEDLFSPLIANTISSLGGIGRLRTLRNPYNNNGRAGLDKVAFKEIYEPKLERERKNSMIALSVNMQICSYQSSQHNKDFIKNQNTKHLIERLENGMQK